jgi:hypothetical protein
MRFPAMFTRTTTEEPAMPATPETPSSVVMRFQTQGEAVVELYRHQWTETHYATKNTSRKSFDRTGFEWRCNGCGMTGAAQRLRMDGAGYHETDPRESRDAANAHAAGCYSMPRPA